MPEEQQTNEQENIHVEHIMHRLIDLTALLEAFSGIYHDESRAYTVRLSLQAPRDYLLASLSTRAHGTLFKGLMMSKRAHGTLF